MSNESFPKNTQENNDILNEEVESFDGHKKVIGETRRQRERDFLEKSDELKRDVIMSELTKAHKENEKIDSSLDLKEKPSIMKGSTLSKNEKKSWVNRSWEGIKRVLGNRHMAQGVMTKVVMAPTVGLAMSGSGTESRATDHALPAHEKTFAWNAPSDSSSKEKDPGIDKKKLEQLGITWIQPLEVSDTTKQVFLIAMKEYKSYGDVFTALDKAGFKPSSVETMDEALLKNETTFRKAGNVISLKEIVSKLGNPSYGTMTWDEKENAFNGESREIGVIPGGKKKGSISNFDSDYDRYTFIVEMPASKTAPYESGLTKSK